MCIQAPVVAAPSRRSTNFDVDALPDGNVYNTFKPNTKGASAGQSPWNSTPLAKPKGFASVVISYTTRMLGHCNGIQGHDDFGKQPPLLWGITNALSSNGIKVFVAPMTTGGEDWTDKFFGQMGNSKCKVVLALYTNAYFEDSPKCMEELVKAAKFRKKIIPLLMEHGIPQKFLQLQEGWLNETPLHHKHAKFTTRLEGAPVDDDEYEEMLTEKGTNLQGIVGQMIPQPGNRFQDNWAENVAKLVDALKSLGC